MKKIIFLCVAVFLFTVSIVNVVWFQGKKEQKAHLTLNNIVALAQGGENIWVSYVIVLKKQQVIHIRQESILEHILL